MPGETAVGVDDDFSPGQSRIAVGSAYHEPAGRVDEYLCLFIQECFGDNRPDHAGDDIFTDLLKRNHRAMLGGNDHGVDPDRPLAFIFNRHLGLAVRAQVRDDPLLPRFRQAPGKSVGKGNRGWQIFRCLVGGKSEHHPLISSAYRIEIIVMPFSLPRISIARFTPWAISGDC